MVAVNNRTTDSIFDAFGADGFVHDAAKLVRTVPMLLRGHPHLQETIRVIDGDAVAIAHAVDHFVEVGTKTVPTMMKAVQASGRVGAAVLRAAPVVSVVAGVLSCAYDTSKAVNQNTGRAWATAGMTIAGTVVGTVGAAIVAAPAGAALGSALLIGSAALGAFQLADSYLFHDKGTQAVADTAARAWSAVKRWTVST